MHLAFLDAFENGGIVGFLGAGKLAVAVQDGDLVVTGQRQCVLNAGIAGADDDNALVLIFVRIVELILHVGQVFAGASELADIALQANRQDDEFRAQRASIGKRERKVSARTRDALHRRCQAQIEFQAGGAVRPGAQYLLAPAGFEGQGAAQWQHRRLRHYVLAFLIAKDGVGEMRLGFEKHVTQSELGRARSR